MTRESTDQTESIPSVELVRVENLQVHFPLHSGRLRRKKAGVVRAVDGVSFTLRRGETLALVGATGCGKTTAARAVAMLDRPTAGRILFDGQELTKLRGRQLKRARRCIQMLFSDPYVAFAPRMTVEEIIVEALELSGIRRGRQRDQRLIELMTLTGLNPYLTVRYPRDLSGGYRQCVALTRALAAEPSLLICDQPTERLDQAMGYSMTDLLYAVNRRLGLTMLLLLRQLELARRADRVAIMIMGRVVEMGYYADLACQPLHPFTQALLQAPFNDSAIFASEALDPLHPIPGCHYAPACPLAEARCRSSFPAFVEGAPNHGVACHLIEPI